MSGVEVSKDPNAFQRETSFDCGDEAAMKVTETKKIEKPDGTSVETGTRKMKKFFVASVRRKNGRAEYQLKDAAGELYKDGAWIPERNLKVL